MQEAWKPVVGHEGKYEVSDQGRVRSLDRWIECETGTPRARRWFHKGRILKARPSGTSPYLRVSLGFRSPSRSVHSLVAEAFIGARPEGLQICHNNGDHLDNRAENLRYDTQSANQRDSILHGTNAGSRKTHCPHGHEYTPGNTQIVGPKGQRRCRECHSIYGKAYYRRRLQMDAAA